MANESSKWLDVLKILIPALAAGGVGAGAVKAATPVPESSCRAEVAVLKTRVDNLSEMKTDVKELKVEVRELSEDVAKLLYFAESHRAPR